jgi:hypothetical protein
MVDAIGTLYSMANCDLKGPRLLKKAKFIFGLLDVNGDGEINQDEFVQGCMKDKQLVALLSPEAMVTIEEDEARMMAEDEARMMEEKKEPEKTKEPKGKQAAEDKKGDGKEKKKVGRRPRIVLESKWRKGSKS